MLVHVQVEAYGRIRRLDLAHEDLLREAAALVRLGWTRVRFDAAAVCRRPARIARVVEHGLDRRGYVAA